MVAASFLAGAFLFEGWRRRMFTAREVILCALLWRILFSALPPVLSDDGYRYVWDGLVQVLEGANPYRYAPADPALHELHDTAVYDRLNSASYHSVYPPASQLVFASGALLYEAGGWKASFFFIKGLFALMEGVLVWVLYRRGVSASALLLYALHPLVLLEAAGQGHTEAGAALFLVLALYEERAGRGRTASVALAGAVLFKLYPLVLFPFLWRRFGWQAVWPGVAAGALLCVPYVGGVNEPGVYASLELYVRLFEFNAGPYYALKQAAYLLTGTDWSKTFGPLLRAVFLGGLPVLYWMDRHWQWSLERAFFYTIAFFLLCATTVHPWYLLPLLALAAVRERAAWPWQWLGLCAVGTYLQYVPLQQSGAWYWLFVVVGWGGALALAVWSHGSKMVQPVLRWRARRKAQRIADLVSQLSPRSGKQPLRILDLGAGEGYVGEALQEQHGYEVVLVDVGDYNRTALPSRTYDGRRLPHPNQAFGIVVLSFVLHHAEHPDQVLGEALRVAESRVVIAESVYRNDPQRRLLRVLDRWANRMRCGGVMAEGALCFRTEQEWRTMIEEAGGEVLQVRRRGRWIHPQVYMELRLRR